MGPGSPEAAGGLTTGGGWRPSLESRRPPGELGEMPKLDMSAKSSRAPGKGYWASGQICKVEGV